MGKLIQYCSGAAISMVVLFLVGCGSEQQEQAAEPCGEVLTGTVEASDWVEQATGIQTYRYRARPDAESVEFDLLDAEDQQLGVLTVSSETDPEGDQSFRRARFVSADGVNLAMKVREGLSPNGAYRVLAQIERDGDELGMIADFGEEVCVAGQSDRDLPPCVGGLAVTQPAYSLASCGWSRERIGRGEDALTSLSYFTEHPADSAVATHGGLRRGQDETYATLQVLDRGRFTSAEDVNQWAEELGIDAVLGTNEERLLTHVFLDAPWRGEVEEHANYCRAPDVFPRRNFSQCAAGALLGGLNDCIDDLINDPFGDDPEGFDFECEGPGCLGWVWGDPHLQSHDGLAYNFQGAGEFIIAESLEGAPWVVQARFEPIGSTRDLPACQNVTVTTAVATQLGDHRVAIYKEAGLILYIDGERVELGREPLELADGARLERDGRSRYLLKWSSGEQLRVGSGRTMRLDFALPDERVSQVAGLLGFFSGTAEDDFRTRDGQFLTAPLDYDELYGGFGDSWRVGQSESLFDYFDASGPQDYHIDGFPQRDADIDDLPADELDDARDVCRRQGVVDPFVLESCVLDYICMQDAQVAEQAAEVDRPNATSEPGVAVAGQIRVVDSLDETNPGEAQLCPVGPMAYLVPEGPPVELTEALELDQPGMTLAAGQTVRSYFLHLAHLPDLDAAVEGRIRFGQPVHGTVSSAAGLASSAEALGLTTQYPANGQAGHESGDDLLAVAPDTYLVTIRLSSRSDADQARIILVEGGN